MASFLDVCRFTPTAGGTTDWTYSSAVTGYQSPAAAGAVNGCLYRYRAESSDLSQWEVGYGTYTTSGTVLARTTVLFNSSGTTSKINFSSAPQVAIVALAEDLSILFSQIRLTLTQGTPVTTADVTAATSLYLEPYNGSKVSVYDGTAYWATLEVAASTYSIAATQSQTGTTHTNTTLDGLTDTSQLVVGMQVTGTNIAANSTISVINSSTSVTLNNATTGSATNTMTFKLPASTNYDVYLTNSSGVPKMLWSAAWSNDTTPPTRALQNGVEVLSGTTTKLLIGSVRTTSVAGQLEDSHTHRYVSNRYNEQPRAMYATDAAASWTYSTATYRQANANTGNQFDYICCLARPIWAHVQSLVVISSGTGPVNVNVGIGIDTASASSAQLVQIANLSGSTYVPTTATYTGTPGIGRHYVTWLEYGSTGGGSPIETWLATAANNIAGIIGEVAG
jgi:hypothetical protein